MSIFSREEFSRRIENAKKEMIKRGLDLLVVSNPANIYYLTGYSGESYYTHQVVIVSLEEEEPTLILRDMDTPCADHTVFMSPDKTIGYPERYIGGDENPFEFIADYIADNFKAAKTVGVEMDTHFFTARAYVILQNKLKNALFKDAFLLVNWLRTYKSEPELALMRNAGTVATVAMKKSIELIEPGVNEMNVAAEISRAQILGTGETGGQPTFVAMPSGERAAAPHLGWENKPYPDSTAINIELGGKHESYCAGLSRSIHLGKPPQELLDLSESALDGINAALDTVKPEVLCEDVEAAWRKTISKGGYEKPSRIGYSIGIEICPTWIDESASLQQGDKTLLEPGMTFHMICGMWKGQHNFVVSETFAVTDSGYELMSDLDRQLFVK